MVFGKTALNRKFKHAITLFAGLLVAWNLQAQSVSDCGALQSRYDSLFQSGWAEEALLEVQALTACLEASQGDSSLQVAVAWRWTGNRLFALGRLEEAAGAYMTSLDYMERQGRMNHPDRVHALSNLASVESAQGMFAVAESRYAEALEVAESVFGEGAPELGRILSQMGINSNRQGDFQRADDHFRHALALQITALGNEHPESIGTLNNLANNCRSLGDFDSAEQYFSRLLSIERALYGEDHPQVGLVLNNLANNHWSQGRFEEANALYVEALAIQRKELGGRSLSLASSLNNYAASLHDSGNMKQAQRAYEEALNIKKRVLGNQHPDYLLTLSNLAINLRDQGKTHAALKRYRELFGVSRDWVVSSFAGMSLDQMRIFWGQESDWVYQFVEFSERSQQAVRVADLAYDALLFAKGMMLGASNRLDAAVAETEDEAVQRDYLELKEIQRQLASAREEPLSGDEETALLDRVRELEQELTASVVDFTLLREQFLTSWRDVRAALKKGEAAVEVGHYWDEATNRMRHIALVVHPHSRHPEQVVLDVPPLRRQFDGGDWEAFQARMDADLAALYAGVWEPLKAHMHGVNRLYWSPSGDLAQIPLHALHNGQPSGARSYVLDEMEVVALTSSRALVENEGESVGGAPATACALGFINYNASFNASSAAVEWDAISSLSDGLRSATSHHPFSTLMNTEEEVRDMEALLAKSGWKVESWVGDEASEHRLKDRLQSAPPRLLHLATHGFYIPSPMKGAALEAEGGADLRASFRQSDDPLDRAGLLLAGGNYSWLGQADTLIQRTGEDGILTAAEVAQLNLREVDLVVLSACESGVGALNGMEGTMGLFQGFKLAGVHQVLQSYWVVPDAQTRELMESFYSRLDQSAAVAFRAAQQELRSRYPMSPVLWGGFVLVN